jgi:NAD(P)-dependent dehydrogenase (short-subunit alcohol dehydrogenase family)
MLVTGSTGAIGSAVVEAARNEGYRVLAWDRGAADLRDPASLADALPALDRLDALVHCAGVAEVASVEETPAPLWTETLAVNVVSAAELTRVLLPALRRASGHVVFVNAAPGLHAVPRWSAYAASKAALTELADSLRVEEAPNGLRVTSVYPGGTTSELLAKIRGQFGQPYDPARTIQPATLAGTVMTVLDMRADAYLSDVSVVRYGP